jgi:hypothetical protein
VAPERVMDKRDAKWAEYRRIRDAIYSVCWECPNPCVECRQWALAIAFGRMPDTGFDEGCAEAYEAAMEMQRRGPRMLIRIE